MKVIAILTSILAAVVLTSALPVHSADYWMGHQGVQEEKAQTPQKDECLLMAKNCGVDVSSVEQRIERLKGEISKGTAVYSADELRMLKDKLDNAYKELEGSGGGGA